MYAIGDGATLYMPNVSKKMQEQLQVREKLFVLLL